MPAFLSTTQAARLRRIVGRYRNKVKLGKPWNKRTDDELWRKVLSQIVVVGRAEPGIDSNEIQNLRRQVSIKALKALQVMGSCKYSTRGVCET